MPVYLADILGDGVVELVVGDGFHAGRRPTVDRLVVAVGDGHVPRGIAIGRGAKHVAFFGQAQTPGVVVAGADELKGRSVGPEAENTHTKFDALAAHLAVEPAVADHAPDPVVVPVADVARRGMGVAHVPPFEEHLAFVGLVVAVGVAQEERLPALDDDQSTVGVAEACRDGELVGEDGELIGLAIAVGVFADFDPVAAFAGFLQFIRIIDRLGNPQPSASVKRHADGFQEEGLGRP